jgi:hypothetical protein
MPGFRYMFKPEQIDLIIEFLKTVEPNDKPNVPSSAVSG